MKNLSEISALFFILLLSFNTTVKADAGFEVGKNRDTEERTSLIYQTSNPNLFAIHHQEKTGVNLLETLPEANSADHSQNDLGARLIESFRQKQPAIYLQSSKTIDCSLAVKKIIFPFHSYW